MFIPRTSDIEGTTHIGLLAKSECNDYRMVCSLWDLIWSADRRQGETDGQERVNMHQLNVDMSTYGYHNFATRVPHSLADSRYRWMSL